MCTVRVFSVSQTAACSHVLGSSVMGYDRDADRRIGGPRYRLRKRADNIFEAYGSSHEKPISNR